MLYLCSIKNVSTIWKMLHSLITVIIFAVGEPVKCIVRCMSLFLAYCVHMFTLGYISFKGVHVFSPTSMNILYYVHSSATNLVIAC